MSAINAADGGHQPRREQQRHIGIYQDTQAAP
eukprot:COSAG04_NODE_15502_length_530_cov_0.923434_1_plen_31_part_01